ncbi:E3 ubiquitin-protein ligase TRIM9 isoform X2 [Trichogramma pretiosum]|uniref:E3 ubiquitin-protein ligase TRIM9 isoform X2 n=1 Tax=Trichogramma pretiosum TaxID=7493 RepID=UPI000C71AEF0|nr:E3 ubiquitin-protein ligase TRIM9 isoform X2 [Trichogramma pretiosum]
MEDELRCPSCKKLYVEPVLLPCWHSLCLACAVNLQAQPSSVGPAEGSASSTTSSSHESSSNGNGHVVGTDNHNGHNGHNGSLNCDPEADKVSILSETDSGVVCSTSSAASTGSSRPGSYVGTPGNGGGFPPSGGTLCLSCPVCQKTVFFDDGGANNLPKYKAMQRIVDKYLESKNVKLLCQMCEKEPREATVACEQCEVLYCEGCRESCHPMRGPLAAHHLGPAQGTWSTGPRNSGSRLDNGLHHGSGCAEHSGEQLSLYCALCKVAACGLCLRDRHTTHPHDVLPLTAACKAQKTELSQNLQQLSERARSTTEFIQRLKRMTDKVHEECISLEEDVEERINALITQLQSRKMRLVEAARQTREARVRLLREQVSRCASHLQTTTGLLTFCIEALKETDSAAFLQIGGMLAMRAAAAAGSWGGAEGVQEIARLPLLDLTLDDKPVRRAIDQLTFVQMKPMEGEEPYPTTAPGAPLLIAEECSAENNSVTVAWQAPHVPGQRGPAIEGYLLELDDGCGGEFREVYCGRETICTVDGLHFNSLYNARVRAFNSAGEGEYSELIGLQTAEVAWFSWALSAPGVPQEISMSEDCMSAACEGYEHRVVLSNVGFSRGIHYWEISIDRYHSDTDPAFGIARADVSRDQMLGKDDRGWSMYIDRQRSWFMHAGMHAQRTDGGIQQGATVGLLLDLEHTHTLRFFVNDQAQGGIAFRDLYGVFYPACSLNRGVTVTLHTALEVPRHLLIQTSNGIEHQIDDSYVVGDVLQS